MHEHGLVAPERLAALFGAIKMDIPRYPAIDAACFAGRVREATNAMRDGQWP